MLAGVIRHQTYKWDEELGIREGLNALSHFRRTSHLRRGSALKRLGIGHFGGLSSVRFGDLNRLHRFRVPRSILCE
eukprot:3292003-Pyramimonas_sp.AAC.1